MQRSTFCLMLCLSLIPLLSFVSGVEQADCMVILKESFKKLNVKKAPDLGKAYYFDYEVKVEMSNDQVPVSIGRVKVFLSKEYIQVLSKEIEVYHDTQNSFTVIPLRKMIYWKNSGPGEPDSLVQQMSEQMSMVKDKVIDGAKLISCKKVSGQSGYDMEMTVQPADQIKQVYQISSIRFLVNEKKKMIYKTILGYMSDSRFKNIEITYHELDYDRKVSSNTSSRSKVLKADGTLQEKYSGYKMNDLRTKKK